MSAKGLTADLHRQLAAVEDEHLPMIAQLYVAAIRQIAIDAEQQFALTAAANPDWQPPVDGAIITVAEIAAVAHTLNDKLEPVWEQVVLGTAKQPLARIEIDWTLKHPLAQNILAKAGQRTGVQLDQAVQYTLRETLAHAYDNGLNVAETSALIQQKITDAAPFQADMLARTDLNSLANGASKAAAQLAGVGYKTWLATLDDKTRIEHAEAHGQVVAINSTFTVGGEDADYPGDPNLSDAMACNCRCTVAYGDTLGEAEGLTAAGLRSSDERGIMRGMATKEQGRRKYQRRAARARPNTKFKVAVDWDRLSADETEQLLALLQMASATEVVKPHVISIPAGSVPVIEYGENGVDRVLSLTAAAIPVHHTSVIDKPWDGNAAMGRASSAADYRSISAWVDSNGDPSERQSYKFPHHDNPGGPANINGVNAAMSRLSGPNDVPPGEVAGVRAHLAAHQADYKKNKAAMVASPQPVRFNGTAAVEGQIADDNSMTPRVLLPDSLSWPEMPLSFMAQTATAEGHDGAEVVGRVDEFARKKMMGKKQSIYTAGELTNDFGINEIAPMIENKTMRYVSADLGATEWAIVGRSDLAEIPMDDLSLEDLQAGKYALGLTSGKMKALTLLPTQALEGAMVALVASAEEHGIAMSRLDEEDTARLVTLLASAGQATDDGPYYRVVVPVSDAAVGVSEALVASPAPRDPPREWFETQEPPGKMPLTVTKEGRVYGHLATWDSCHASFLPQCVPPPKSPSNYARFHTGYIDVEDGGEITVGKLMFSPSNGGHADRRLSAAKASAYYDKTGMAAAFLRATDGQHGVWVAGALNHKLSDSQREEMRRELRLNPPSGDWRVYDGQYDLLCGLAVAIPGFGVIPSAEVSIVASAEGVELQDAIIASSGWFEPDDAAVAAMEHLGLVDEDTAADRRIEALAARAQGLDALAALVE
jgi:hypothetical protein